MKTLLVWGSSKDGIANIRPILANLRKNFVDVKWEWEIYQSQETDRHQIPADCEFVLILKDFMGHPQVENIVEQAKRRNVPVIKTAHRWSIIYTELVAKRIIIEEREVMGATPDKAPEALVIGGYLADRAEVISRMIHSGWKVKEHWLANEGGHEYSKARNGIKLIVVMRDTLENKQYQQAHTLAQLSRVPVIKWDINRELFRKRLEQQHLLFEPIQMPAPPPAEEPITPLVPGTPVYDDALLNSPQAEKPIEIKGHIERRASVPATSAFDSLIAACNEVIEDLHSNPMFRGVNIRIQEDGSSEITPIARPFKLGATSARAVQKAVELPPPPQSLTTAADPASSKVVPRAPPPRPVVQPIVPKYEEPPRKPRVIVKGKSGRGKGYLKGQKLNMECRYPGCKARSLGPRFGFMCKAHQDIPVAQKKEYQKLFNAAHPM